MLYLNPYTKTVLQFVSNLVTNDSPPTKKNNANRIAATIASPFNSSGIPTAAFLLSGTKSTTGEK